MVQLFDTHYFLSPYKTETQKTIIKLASNNVESYTKLEPYSLKGSVLTLGSYNDIAPLTLSPLTVHYTNNKPFARMSSMTREVEVSHWGNIAVEEIYEIQNVAAKLKGGFSRLDYQMKRQADSSSSSFNHLSAILPKGSRDIYYRDQIGNISSSDLTFKSDSVILDIEPRFPLFGGWQTQFYIGYSIPTESALFIDQETGRYKLKFDFYTIFENVWVEDMEVKFILPEGCTDIKVDVPYPSTREDTIRYTYLDSEYNGGRPVISIKAKNLVEEHNEQIVISYLFNTQRMLVEPLTLVASFFVFFFLLSVLARLELKLGSQEKSKSS